MSSPLLERASGHSSVPNSREAEPFDGRVKSVFGWLPSSLLSPQRCFQRRRDCRELIAGTISFALLTAAAIAATMPLLLPLLLLGPAYRRKRSRYPPRARIGRRVAKRKLRMHRLSSNGEQSGTDKNSTATVEGRSFHKALAAAIQACSERWEDPKMREGTQHEVESITLLPDFGLPAADAADSLPLRWETHKNLHRELGRSSSVVTKSYDMKLNTEFKLGTQLSLFDLGVIRASGPCFVVKVKRHSVAPVYVRFRWAGRCAIAAAAWQPAAEVAGTSNAETGEHLGCVVTGTHGKHRTWFNVLYRMPRSFTRCCIMSFLLFQVDALNENDPTHFMYKKNIADHDDKLGTSNSPLILGF